MDTIFCGAAWVSKHCLDHAALAPRPCGACICIFLLPCIYTLPSPAGQREHSALLFHVHRQSLLCQFDTLYFCFLSLRFQCSCQLTASPSLTALAAISHEVAFVRPEEKWSCSLNTLADLPAPEDLLQCHTDCPEDSPRPHLSQGCHGSAGMWACKLISEDIERIILAHKMRNLLNCFRRFKAPPCFFKKGLFELQSRVEDEEEKELAPWPPTPLLLPPGLPPFALFRKERDLLSIKRTEGKPSFPWSSSS